MENMHNRRKNEGRVYADPRTGYMIVEWSVSGKRFRIYTHSDDREGAEKLRRQKIAERDRGIIYNPVVNRCKFKELAEDAKADYLRKGNRTEAQLKMKLDKFILPFFGHLIVPMITKPLIDQYGDERAKTVSNDTVNHEFRIIRYILNLGVRNGKVFNPPYIQMRRKAEPRQSYYQYSEAVALVKELPEPLRNLPLFYFLTGWRLREALNLEWNMVDFENRVLRIPGRLTKNGKDKIYAYNEDSRLDELMRQQREYTDKWGRQLSIFIRFVFHREGRQIKDFRAAWDSAHTRANLVRRTVHAFRRSLKTICEYAGISDVFSMKVMGHESVNVSRNYAIADIHSSRDTTAKIEREIDRRYGEKK